MLDQYKNEDGTYTSPRNNKTYKSLKAFTAHWHHNPAGAGWIKSNYVKQQCQFCQRDLTLANINKHELTCWMNPKVMRKCKVCDKPIKNYKESKGTCSYSCSNIYFRSGEQNGMWSGNNYQLICFANHKKECIVCGENKIVAVHHADHNHNNNDPENLIPMCPTHHQYVHSQYRSEVQPVIDKYINDRRGVAGGS